MRAATEIKDKMTYAFIEGRIDSANAHELEAAFEDVPGDTNGVIIDASGLTYISSAGLRIFLSVKKRCRQKVFRITGVNRDVMHIFDITGFSEIMDVEAAPREINIEGCEVIGTGACGECYRLDDETILKLYYKNMDRTVIEREKMLSKKAFIMGMPTAISYDIVQAGGRSGVVYELIKSRTLGELMRTDEKNLDKYIRMYVDVCQTVHAIHTDDPEIPSFKDRNRKDIARIMGITEQEREYLYRFLDLVPDSNTCIHGDLNINNVMVQDGDCCLIDMGELSTGIPMFDISRILFSMIYANTAPGEYNIFYKMQPEKVEEICEKFLCGYFGCDTLDAIEKVHPEAVWLHPLAWLRCCTSFLKGSRWTEEKRKMALKLLREKLIPFVDGKATIL